jgi:hypothetical protein
MVIDSLWLRLLKVSVGMREIDEPARGRNKACIERAAGVLECSLEYKLKTQKAGVVPASEGACLALWDKAEGDFGTARAALQNGSRRVERQPPWCTPPKDRASDLKHKKPASFTLAQ